MTFLSFKSAYSVSSKYKLGTSNVMQGKQFSYESHPQLRAVKGRCEWSRCICKWGLVTLPKGGAQPDFLPYYYWPNDLILNHLPTVPFLSTIETILLRVKEDNYCLNSVSRSLACLKNFSLVEQQKFKFGICCCLEETSVYIKISNCHPFPVMNVSHFKLHLNLCERL